MKHFNKLKETHPDLVEGYSKMSKEELLNQICAEVLDLHFKCEQVQFFMNECTIGMSKINYPVKTLEKLVTDKKEKDIQEFCHYETVDGLPDSKIVASLKEKAQEHLS